MRTCGVISLSIAIALPLMMGADGGCDAPPGLVAYSAQYQATSWGSSTCNTARTVHGYAPATSTTTQLPVFAYLPGTFESYDTFSDSLLQAMARRGYLAVFIEYDNVQLSDCRGTYEATIARCAFDASSPASALAVACSATGDGMQADCAGHGLVVAGLSQGGMLSMMAATYNTNVRADWAISVSDHADGGLLGIYDETCYLDDPAANPSSIRALPSSRLRVVDGVNDTLAIAAPVGQTGTPYLQAITGTSCTGPHCLRDDGSGYYQVTAIDVAPAAGYTDLLQHCFYDDVPPGDGDCSGSGVTDPRLAPGAADTGPASVDANLDWLDSFVRH